MATRLHQRKVIRDAVLAALTYKTCAGDRVFASRRTPWDEKKLPAISIYATEEPVDPDSVGTAPRELTRTVEVVIDCVVDPYLDDALDDRMDAHALEVEDAMDAWIAAPEFTTAASEAILVRTSLGTIENARRPMAAVQLVYAVTYRTEPYAPTAGDAADLATVDVKTSLGGAQASADQAEDKIENLDEEA